MTEQATIPLEYTLPTEQREKPLAGKVIIITGASRGIGAETAKTLALQGATIIAPHRQEQMQRRANEVVAEIEDLGGTMVAPLCDITDPQARECLFSYVDQQHGKIDVLIHNAASGLEKGATAEYAREVNALAKAKLTEVLLPLLSDDGIIIDNASLWSQFSGRDIPQLQDYDLVASTKKEGERLVRNAIRQFNKIHGTAIRFGIVCGQAIEDTYVTASMQKKHAGQMQLARNAAVNGTFPRKVDMANAFLKMTTTPVADGHVEFVGIPTWEKDTIQEMLWMYNDTTRFVDRMVFFNPEKSFGYYTVADEDCAGHFTERADISLFPGHAMIEQAAQAAGLTYLKNNGTTNHTVPIFRSINGPIQFLQPVFPGDTIEIESTLVSQDNNSFGSESVLRVGETKVGVILGIDCGIVALDKLKPVLKRIKDRR